MLAPCTDSRSSGVAANRRVWGRPATKGPRRSRRRARFGYLQDRSPPSERRAMRLQLQAACQAKSATRHRRAGEPSLWKWRRDRCSLPGGGQCHRASPRSDQYPRYCLQSEHRPVPPDLHFRTFQSAFSQEIRTRQTAIGCATRATASRRYRQSLMDKFELTNGSFESAGSTADLLRHSLGQRPGWFQSFRSRNAPSAAPSTISSI